MTSMPTRRSPLPAFVAPLLLAVVTVGVSRAAAADPAPEPVAVGRQTAPGTRPDAAGGKDGGTTKEKDAAGRSRAATLDPATVYRYDPIESKLVAVRPAEIKTDHVYYRYSASRKRHVWSKAAGQGRFLYVMGPGSVQVAKLFDIRATAEEKQKALESRSPAAAKLFATRGAPPAFKLDESDRWSIATVPTDGSVFDLETGRRFEWHGDRPVEVVHSGGNAWTRQGDRYAPAFTGPVVGGW